MKIQLTPTERRELTSRIVRGESAFALWQSILVARNFKCPADKVYRITPASDDFSPREFTLRLEPKKLGEKAIHNARIYQERNTAHAQNGKYELYVPPARIYARR